MALAGGVNLILGPENMIAFSKARMLAPDGRCKTFDARADGFADGEGCGIVVLKRLADARREPRPRAGGHSRLGDQPGRRQQRPHGAERAGPGSAHPRGAAQCLGGSVRRRATSRRTAPALRSAIPSRCRRSARCSARGARPDRPFLLGAAKANIGHLEAAAGIAGLIKVALILEHEARCRRSCTSRRPTR